MNLIAVVQKRPNNSAKVRAYSSSANISSVIKADRPNTTGSTAAGRTPASTRRRASAIPPDAKALIQSLSDPRKNQSQLEANSTLCNHRHLRMQLCPSSLMST